MADKCLPMTCWLVCDLTRLHDDYLQASPTCYQHLVTHREPVSPSKGGEDEQH